MDQLITNFGRVEWWINTIFIALLVSLMAGFLRDFIPRWLSGMSAWSRKRARNNLRTIARQARLISTDVHLHIDYTFILLLQALTLVFAFALAITLGPLHYFYELNPEYDPVGSFFFKGRRAVIGFVSLGFLLIMMPLQFTLGRHIRVLRRMRRIALRRARVRQRDLRKHRSAPSGAESQ